MKKNSKKAIKLSLNKDTVAVLAVKTGVAAGLGNYHPDTDPSQCPVCLR